MSNHLAIAAVTAALQNLLFRALQGENPGVRVTAKPLDQARHGDGPNQVNLFLYEVRHNAALRNQELPRQGRPGESAPLPLAINLHYLLTIYSQGDDGAESHKLLGKAMLALHDHAVLSPSEIRDALPGNDLHQQTERVRITPEPLALEEMSKLWNNAQAQYRLSVGYQVSALLIESTRPARAPLPVLTVGLRSQQGLVPPYPALTAINPPNQQLGVRLGETLTLSGTLLDGERVEAQFMTSRWTEPVTLTAVGISDTEATVTIPAGDRTAWPAGAYTVAAIIRKGVQSYVTNALPVCLSPKLDSITPPSLTHDQNGQIILNVIFTPHVWAEQRVSLLLGEQESVAPPRNSKVPTLRFTFTDAPSGPQYVRLRVDGVDSEFINRAASPPVFDDTQRVILP
jgi:hypothetical protein